MHYLVYIVVMYMYICIYYNIIEFIYFCVCLKLCNFYYVYYFFAPLFLKERYMSCLSIASMYAHIRRICMRQYWYRHARRATAYISLYAVARRCVWTEDIYIYIHSPTDENDPLGLILSRYNFYHYSLMRSSIVVKF